MTKQIKFTGNMLVAAKTNPVARLKQRSEFVPHVGKKQLERAARDSK